MKLFLATTVVGALLASAASAAPSEVPYTMQAVHADLHSQLMTVGGEGGDVGSVARVAAQLFESQNAGEATYVLPLTGVAGALVAAQVRPHSDLPDRARLFEAELPRLRDGCEQVIAAMAELYAAADSAGNDEVSRLAERVIWHQTNDMEVLYPNASLVSAILINSRTAMPSESVIPAHGPLYGPNPIPMMGIGDPHALK